MKQLKIFFAIMMCIIMSSCKSLETFYQICDVKSSLSTSSNGSYEYKDKVCSVSYDFWCEGGNPGFVFSNDTDQIIYVDLNKSFFIKNGIAYDYFLNRSIGSSSAYSTSVSASKGGSVYGLWSRLYPGTLSASIGATASSHKTNSIVTEEKSIIAIPPHSSKIIYEYNIADKEFFSCDFNMTPNNKSFARYDFSLKDSPAVFSNFITYRLGEDLNEHTISNEFYISSITNYNKKTAIQKIEIGCPGKKTKATIIKEQSPNKFYIMYNREVNSRIGISNDESFDW